MFRKITTAFIALLLVFSLSGCMIIPVFKHIELRYGAFEIASVELYDIGGQRYLGRFEHSVGRFEHSADEGIDQMEEELDPVDALDAEQYESFVKDLEKLTFSHHIVLILASMQPPVHSFDGYTIKITYQNGDYDILSYACQLYDSGDDYVENEWNCDEDEWNAFIKSYFSVDTSTSAE